MRALLSLCVCLCVLASFAAAQESLEDLFKRKVKERAEQKKEEGVEAGLDAAEEGAKDAVKGATTKKKAKKAKNADEEAVEEEENAEQAESDEAGEADEAEAPAPAKAAAKPAFASYSKFDFVPGEQVLMFEDFSQDAVGDFPARWDTDGSGEVVTISSAPGKWLKTADNTAYFLPLGSTLPENFTLECDLLYVPHGSGMNYYLEFIEGMRDDEQMSAIVPGKKGVRVNGSAYNVSVAQWHDYEWGNISNTVDTKAFDQNEGVPVHISIAVQKQRLRLFMNQHKAFDVAKLVPANAKFDKIRFSTQIGDDELYISNIRLAVGAPDMRSKLITEGKLVTHGITFDSGSDKIRPESYGTLKSIAGVLKENGAVKVRIVGHTDSDGTEKGNMDLSKRRAESVKSMLSKEFGIEAARMSTEGKGQSQPVSPNTTSEGKANNRRVEFVKM